MAGSKTNALKKPDVKMFKLYFKIKNEKKPFTAALLQNYNNFFFCYYFVCQMLNSVHFTHFSTPNKGQ